MNLFLKMFQRSRNKTNSDNIIKGEKGEKRFCLCKVDKEFNPIPCPCWEISELKKDEKCSCNVFKRLK